MAIATNGSRPKAPLTTLALNVAVAAIAAAGGMATMYIAMVDRMDRIEQRLRASDELMVEQLLGRMDLSTKSVEKRLERTESRFDVNTANVRDEMIRLQATVFSALENHRARLDQRLISFFSQFEFNYPDTPREPKPPEKP